MATYEISYSGRLFDSEKQQELTEKLFLLGQIYTDIYFGEDNDESTLVFFDNVILKGKIEISDSLLNIPADCTAEQILPLTRFSSYSYLCDEVILYGVQFLDKTGINLTRLDKKELDTISYVFWGFNSTTEQNSLIKWNVAKVSKPIYSMHKFDYKLSSPYLSSRLVKMWFETDLFDFVAHYYFESSEMENTMLWDINGFTRFRKYLIENDPEANNKEFKVKTFEALIEDIKKKAKFDREMDEIEIKHNESTKNSVMYDMEE